MNVEINMPTVLKLELRNVRQFIAENPAAFGNPDPNVSYDAMRNVWEAFCNNHRNAIKDLIALLPLD